MWVPFNEGWGQFDTARIAELTQKLDPTRLVNCASGWNDCRSATCTTSTSIPAPAAPQLGEAGRACWASSAAWACRSKGTPGKAKDNWGYRSYTNKDDFTGAYSQLVGRTSARSIGKGLSAAVYTQTTDVEIEVNGLMTYDRAVIKLDEKQIAAAARPALSAAAEGDDHRADLAKGGSERGDTPSPNPPDGWEKPGFDDAAWKEGPGGFGEKSTPGTTVRTEWKTPDIWLRRTFELPSGKHEGLHLAIHHDEDAEVYLNGVLACQDHRLHHRLHAYHHRRSGLESPARRDEHDRRPLPSNGGRAVYRRGAGGGGGGRQQKVIAYGLTSRSSS